MSIGIGLYGTNGHQIQNVPISNELGKIVAVADFPRESLPPALRDAEGLAVYDTLDELLKDERVQLVSLCSARRREQAEHAIRALRAGKHVYAEKPCALSEPELDAILAAARESGRQFHEMAGTAFEQPYLAMRQVVQKGTLGEIVQVICEKSYPYHDHRPQDEEVDGGLIEQVAIHAMRFVEHVAGMRVASIQSTETSLGNPIAGGGLRMASAMIARLENGGVASLTANYLNPRGTGVWGYESLRIFGTKGMLESTRGGTETRLVLGEVDHGPIDTSEPGLNFLEVILRSISGKGEMPFTLEEELRPTRWVIRAKQELL